MLVNRLAASLKNDNLIIPVMPELATKLSRLVGDSNVTTKELARVIGSDTGVTAQVIRLSQTLRYSNPGTTITSLPAAISRIGLNSTVSMALALAIEQSFYFRNSVVVKYCHDEISRSFMVCSYALTICAIRYGIMPNLVYDYVVLASSLLNIGYLPFLVEVDTYVLGQGKGYKLDYEDLKAKASAYDAAEEASKTDLQKATERANELQSQLDALTRANQERDLREQIAKETGVPASLLRGGNEDDLRAQAEGIKGFVTASKASYPTVRDGGETSTPSITREQILSIKSEKERLKAIRENIELFK